ncbi:MAG TPA: sigma-70 family RNA polymerase sigma factor [Chthoniobacterales bacterium]
MRTHWNVYAHLPVETHQFGSEKAQQALTQLFEDYWPPLYRFVRHRGYSRADAEDLTQGFFVYLVETRAYRRLDRRKGRFRTFLLILLKRYLSASAAYHGRQKRGGDEAMLFLDAKELDVIETEDDALLIEAPLDEERVFELNWARILVERAMESLKAEYAGGLRARILAELLPFLTGGVGLPTQEKAAAHLGVPIETLRSQLFRLRSRYRTLLRAEVARTVPADQDVESELRYLYRILIASA